MKLDTESKYGVCSGRIIPPGRYAKNVLFQIYFLVQLLTEHVQKSFPYWPRLPDFHPVMTSQIMTSLLLSEESFINVKPPLIKS